MNIVNEVEASVNTRFFHTKKKFLVGRWWSSSVFLSMTDDHLIRIAFNRQQIATINGGKKSRPGMLIKTGQKPERKKKCCSFPRSHQWKNCWWINDFVISTCLSVGWRRSIPVGWQWKSDYYWWMGNGRPRWNVGHRRRELDFSFVKKKKKNKSSRNVKELEKKRENSWGIGGKQRFVAPTCEVIFLLSALCTRPGKRRKEK